MVAQSELLRIAQEVVGYPLFLRCLVEKMLRPEEVAWELKNKFVSVGGHIPEMVAVGFSLVKLFHLKQMNLFFGIPAYTFSVGQKLSFFGDSALLGFPPNHFKVAEKNFTI